MARYDLRWGLVDVYMPRIRLNSGGLRLYSSVTGKVARKKF